MLQEFEFINKSAFVGAVPLYIDIMMENMKPQQWYQYLRDHIYEPNGEYARHAVTKEKFWQLATQMQQNWEIEQTEARKRDTIGSIEGPHGRDPDQGSRSPPTSWDDDGYNYMDESAVNAVGRFR